MPTLNIGRTPLVRALLPVGSQRRRLVARTVRRVWPPKALVKHRRSEVARLQEEAKLKGVWKSLRPDMLDIYLVSGFQDPRLNAQSIIGRHTLVRALFGSKFEALMTAELAHAARLNDAIRLRGLELKVPLTATMDQERQAGVQRVMEVVADDIGAYGEK
ncbi:MAG TPA: hypothetical protein VF635_07160, partial [Propionibacteriaceae bacterium]